MTQITQRNAAKLHYFAEKDRLMVVLFLGLLWIRLWLSGRFAGDIGGAFWWLIEYACVFVSRRLRWSRRGNAASCIISQRKTVCSLFGFVACLRKSAWSAWDILGSICTNRLSTLACYSPADSADDAEECSWAALFRRERQVVWGCCSCCSFAVLGFICVNLRDLRETLGFHLCW